MTKIDPQSWKSDIADFREKTAAFFAGEMEKSAYKGFSGRYGSYAQKGGKASMLRLRMPAGRVTPEKLSFVADVIRKKARPAYPFHDLPDIQLHDLDQETTCSVMEQALDYGIVTIGGGGDFPRNVMCSPLSGVEDKEYFDVLPWAEAAGDYLMNFINAKKMPRKLKVGFSNSPENITHATYRDLGFVARPDGKFDVYSAGGLGNNPRFGVKVAEAIEPQKILYYIKAMWLMFCAYGNYENRGKARTRYMQETLGSSEAYVKAFQEKLKETQADSLDLTVTPAPITKTGDGTAAEGARVLPQKQAGLYTVMWHPIGGQPDLSTFCAVSDALSAMPGAEMRLSPDETAYIINLTGTEAQRMLDITADGAQTLFETSVSCIGSSTCQVGLRDSQALLRACIDAVRAANLPDDALPQIHISGCPSSCGTHQTGALGFRGATKRVDNAPQSAFLLFVNGNSRQGQEVMGREVGVILEKEIPDFLVKLGQTVADSGKSFTAWLTENPQGIDTIAAPYIN